MIGLDYKPDWGNAATGDPGTDIISTTGLDYTTLVEMDNPSGEPEWEQTGIWKVIGPHSQPTNTAPTTEGWSMQGSNRNAYGFDFAGVGSNLQFFTAHFVDADEGNWGDFFTTSLIPYQLTNTVYVRLSTDNNNFQATYSIPAGGKRIANAGGEYIYVDWRGGSNGHAGNAWAFLLAGAGADATKIGITFKQSPF